MLEVITRLLFGGDRGESETKQHELASDANIKASRQPAKLTTREVKASDMWYAVSSDELRREASERRNLANKRKRYEKDLAEAIASKERHVKEERASTQEHAERAVVSRERYPDSERPHGLGSCLKDEAWTVTLKWRDSEDDCECKYSNIARPNHLLTCDLQRR